MKQDLLEYIIRECAKEVLHQVNEEEEKSAEKSSEEKTCKCGKKFAPHNGEYARCPECLGNQHTAAEKATGVQEGDPEIKGAAAPPADGQGTAEQPPLPNPEPAIPETPQTPELKMEGIVLVNPTDKSKLQKLELGAFDDAKLERALHAIAFHLTGSKTKIALSTMRAVKDAIKNPSGAVFLYLGKNDPDSDEIFLLSDKSLNVAKEGSVAPEELPAYASKINPNTFNPLTARASDFAQHMSSAGQKVPQAINEDLVKAIKTMVEKMLDGE